MSDKEKSALRIGGAIGFVCGMLSVLTLAVLIAHGRPAGMPEPPVCQESAYTLDGHDSVGATCPVGTRLTMHSESRALCLCPRP